MSLVKFWAPADRTDDLADGLFTIFAEAVHFSQYLRRQRAMWSVRFPQRPVVIGHQGEIQQSGPLMFEPAAMKDDYGEDEEMDKETLRRQTVELVITPALYKRGNLDGERFDIEYAAAPALVIMYS
jgi:hypothetical protein